MLDRIIVIVVLMCVGTWAATHFSLQRHGLLTPIGANEPQVSSTGNSIQIPQSYNGHFFVAATVNGASIDFLIDSGATDIVLNEADARRAGVNLRTLRYTKPVLTANGRVMIAPVRLRELRIGQLRLHDISASINPAPMDVSLLGMSFLNSLRGWEVSNGRLQLHW